MENHIRFTHPSSIEWSGSKKNVDETPYNKCIHCDFHGVSLEALEKHMDFVHHGKDGQDNQNDSDLTNWRYGQEISAQRRNAQEIQSNTDSDSLQLKIEWNGKELFAPNERKVKHRSKVWNHGGLLKDEYGKLDKSRVICSYCGKQLNYYNSPGNIESHLRLHHFTEFNT